MHACCVMTGAHANISPRFKFHGAKETLSTIIEIISNKQKGAYFGFGATDLDLAVNGSELLQATNSGLIDEMREAFALAGLTIIKDIPLYCKEFREYDTDILPGKHNISYEWYLKMLEQVQPLGHDEIRNVYFSGVLNFAATQYLDFYIQFLKFIKKSNCYLFVGNSNIPARMKEALFGSQCIFIPASYEQSYDEIDRIEKECLEKIGNTDEYKIIITALGSSGRALQKRLWHKLDNVFLFDFGNFIDALCNWDTRASIGLAKFDQENFIDNLTSEVKILYTAALLDFDYESRKKEYIHTLDILRSYGYHNPYIVEAIKSGPHTFFNDYSCNVIYSNVNNPKLRNKGINEARSMTEACKKFYFKDNDIIVKITGRYFFTSDVFLRAVEAKPTVDAFVTVDQYGQVFTGCFALRYKFLKEMLHQLDYQKMERNMINIESEVSCYLRKIIQEKDAHVLYLDKIDVTANIMGDGTKYDLRSW